MSNYLSRISSHVYVDNALEAVKLYKEAFLLEDRGTPWIDEEGLLVYQELGRNGALYMSVSERKHLFDEFSKEIPVDINTTMLYIIYFENEEDLRKAYNVLYKEGNPTTGVREEGDTICVFVDRYGVYWHFQVPNDWNASFIPK